MWRPAFVSDLPVVSLALGAAGGVAVVLLDRAAVDGSGGMRFLGYLGKNSIVVYLAFFLPMAVTRGVLLKFAPFLDIGTVSALVTIAGVCGPVILHAGGRAHRPWPLPVRAPAMGPDRKPGSTSTAKAGLEPAE